MRGLKITNQVPDFLHTRLHSACRPRHHPLTHSTFVARSAATYKPSVPSTTITEDEDFEAACPICQQTKFSLKSFQGRGSQPRIFCKRCARSYYTDEVYTDLTLEGLPGAEYKERYWGGTEIFRSPLVSWVYERGWRQNFAGFGFPGPDEETRMALEYMQPAWGETVMDLSCGSGLFSRRFIKSGKFKNVIVSDFSENMLKQSAKFIAEDPSIDASKYTLVRLDAGRLPFETGSLSAIHAGAAIHCWPNASLAVAEISRVLKPGGVFVASTILNPSSGLGSIVGDDTLKPLKQLGVFGALDRFGGATANFRWWSEQELREICERVGLRSWQCNRKLSFILFKVTKPS